VCTSIYAHVKLQPKENSRRHVASSVSPFSIPGTTLAGETENLPFIHTRFEMYKNHLFRGMLPVRDSRRQRSTRNGRSMNTEHPVSTSPATASVEGPHTSTGSAGLRRKPTYSSHGTGHVGLYILHGKLLLSLGYKLKNY
jgi:hypothetical protein